MSESDKINSAKKRKFYQKYRPVWEEDSRFSGWLQPVEGEDTKAQCTLCNVTIQAHMKSLIGHYEAKKHKDLMKGMKANGSPKQKTSLTNNVDQHLIFDPSTKSLQFFPNKEPSEKIDSNLSPPPNLQFVQKVPGKTQADFCSSFGKTVEHWMRTFSSREQLTTAFQIISLLNGVTEQSQDV